jgi:hypothetical protein
VTGNAGPLSWLVDSQYSWFSHRFPPATIRHSWQLHPGSDGGERAGIAQPPGTLNTEFLMCSVGGRVAIGTGATINMDNLRGIAGTTVTDLGSGRRRNRSYRRSRMSRSFSRA